MMSLYNSKRIPIPKAFDSDKDVNYLTNSQKTQASVNAKQANKVN